MTTSLPRAIACSILLATIALSGGCGAQRPLHIVKRDGDAAYKSGDYAKAQADYGEYVNRKPEAHQLRYDLARAYVADGRARSAIEELTIALDVSPLNDDYLDLQAKAMFEADERDALTTLLRRNASERGRVSDFIRLGEYSARLGNADEALVGARLIEIHLIAP